MDKAKLAKMQQSVRIGVKKPLLVSNDLTLTNSSCRVRVTRYDDEWLLPTALTYHVNSRGKGTPRRKVKKVHKSSGSDDKKLQTSLKKLNVQPIQAIEEVNMFKEDGNVIHFAAPKGMKPSDSTVHGLVVGAKFVAKH